MEKVLVAVSGGSDSLALLDMLYKQKKYKIIVCHVNYNYRESSLRDQKIVENYTQKNNIKSYFLNLKSKEEMKGNFEDWARVKRYKFFQEIYIKENCQCLFVGHHQDDLLETYLLQKKRNSIVETYGLATETNIQNMRVVRPLLGYSKKQLEQYCKENKIEYGIDETNYDTTYSRNKIRHEIVGKMSDEERENLIKEIQILNNAKREHLLKIKKHQKDCLVDKKTMDLEKFNQLSNEIKLEVLYYFIMDNVYKKISIKKTRIEDMIKKINSEKPNIILANYGELNIYKEYKMLVIEKNKTEYCYPIFDSKIKELGGGFVIKQHGKKLEKLIVSDECFPLYLKNYDGNNKEVNRIFIDKKIPLRKRKTWPVIVDKFGRLLLVIGIKKFYNELWGSSDNLIEFYICENKGE